MEYPIYSRRARANFKRTLCAHQILYGHNFFQECRCDTVSQECEFLETLKYSSHHCETPKSTEIVKIAIFSGFSDFRSFWAWLHVRNFQICDF